MRILPDLEVFSAIVATGTLTAAAESLGLSKPVVSKRLQRLEESLGVQLFHRTTRKNTLTDAGEILLGYSEDIMAKAREAEQSVLPLQTDPHGVLRITASESLALSILPQALDEFARQCRNLELDVRISGGVMDMLDTGVDVALRVGKLEDSSLMARALRPSKYLVVASPSYWQEHGMPASPAELERLNCFVYSESAMRDNWHFDDHGRRLSIRVSGSFRSDSGKLLLDGALDGRGVMLAPSYLVEQHLADGRLGAALTQYTMPDTSLYAVYPRSRFVPPKVRRFIDFLAARWAHSRT